MMKCSLQCKATILVGVLTFLSSDMKCCRFLDSLFGSFVAMRDGNDDLTREGQIVHSAFFMLITYMVMSRSGGHK